MSDVSLNFRENAYYAEAEAIPICLITIEHDDLATPIRLSTDPTERLSEAASDIVYGTTSNGDEYLFFPCNLRLPSNTDRGPQGMRIQFDNVHRDYIASIRALSSAPKVSIDIVMSNDLDTIEVSFPDFYMRTISYDALAISAGMEFDSLQTETVPAASMLPSTTPNVF